jgi:hypothetical protein
MLCPMVENIAIATKSSNSYSQEMKVAKAAIEESIRGQLLKARGMFLSPERLITYIKSVTYINLGELPTFELIILTQKA